MIHSFVSWTKLGKIFFLSLWKTHNVKTLVEIVYVNIRRRRSVKYPSSSFSLSFSLSLSLSLFMYQSGSSQARYLALRNVFLFCKKSDLLQHSTTYKIIIVETFHSVFVLLFPAWFVHVMLENQLVVSKGNNIPAASLSGSLKNVERDVR